MSVFSALIIVPPITYHDVQIIIHYSLLVYETHSRSYRWTSR